MHNSINVCTSFPYSVQSTFIQTLLNVQLSFRQRALNSGTITAWIQIRNSFTTNIAYGPVPFPTETARAFRLFEVKRFKQTGHMLNADTQDL